MNGAVCPECGRMIQLPGKPRHGQYLVCPFCNSDLEVVSVSPLELDIASFEDDDEEEEIWQEDEDWEDEDEDLWEVDDDDEF